MSYIRELGKFATELENLRKVVKLRDNPQRTKMLSHLFLDWIQISVISVIATGVKLPVYQGFFYKHWKSSINHFIYSCAMLLVPCLAIPALYFFNGINSTRSAIGPSENIVFEALFSLLLLIFGFLIDLALIRRREPDFKLDHLWKKPKIVILTLGVNLLITITLLLVMATSLKSAFELTK